MKHVKEVELKLLKKKNPKRAKESAHIMRTGLEYLGIDSPTQRALFKEGFSFSKENLERQRKIWNDVWNKSKMHEAMNQSLMFFEDRFRKLDKDDWEMIKYWADRVENWAHSDQLAKLYADLLERYPKEVYAQLSEWNRSTNSWLRRLSVTSLLLYSASRKKLPPFKKIIKLVKPLLKDKDTYVQKGVGWTLRETHNVYPKETFEFIERHITDLPAITFSYATEKVDKKKKEKLKKIRKVSRKA